MEITDLMQIDHLNLYTILTMSTIVLMAFFCFQEGPLKTLAFTLLYFMLTATGEMLAYTVISVSFHISYRELYLNDSFFLAGACSSKLITLILVLLIGRLFKKKKLISSRREQLVVCTYALLLICTAWAIPKLLLDTKISLMDPLALMLISFISFLLIFCLFVFFHYDSIIKNRELESALQVNREREKTRDLLFSQYEKNMDEKNKIIHDYKNSMLHLTGISDKPELVRSYCEKLAEQYAKQLDYSWFDVGNEVLNTILGKLKYDCDQYHIELDLQILYADFAFISPTDTSSLFGNLFDNAVEACCALPDSRWIRVMLAKRGDFVHVDVSNAKGHQVLQKKDAFLSTRRQYEQKGYGIDIIKSIAMQYQGDMGITYNEAEFSSAIWLKSQS